MKATFYGIPARPPAIDFLIAPITMIKDGSHQESRRQKIVFMKAVKEADGDRESGESRRQSLALGFHNCDSLQTPTRNLMQFAGLPKFRKDPCPQRDDD